MALEKDLLKLATATRVGCQMIIRAFQDPKTGVADVKRAFQEMLVNARALVRGKRELASMDELLGNWWDAVKSASFGKKAEVLAQARKCVNALQKEADKFAPGSDAAIMLSAAALELNESKR